MKKKLSLAKKLFLVALYIVLVTAFCLLAVGLILYGSGYRLDTQTYQLKKTGLLVINKWGSSENLLIDGEPQTVKTSNLPNFIASSGSVVLLPGSYQIEIIRDGFLPYAETITVQPELITKIEPIIFIPKTLQKSEIMRDTMVSYAVAPDKNTIAYLRSQNELVIFDITNKTQQNILLPVKPAELIHQITWSPDSRIVGLVADSGNSREVYLINKEDVTKIRALKNEFSFFPDVDKFYFSKRSSDTLFAIAKTGPSFNLYRLDTGNKQTTLIDEMISWTSPQEDALFYFTQQDKSYKKLSFDSDTSVTLTQNSQYLPSSIFVHEFEGKNTYYRAGGKLVTNLDYDKSDIIDDSVISVSYLPKYNSLYYLKEGSWDFMQYHLDKKEIKKLATTPGLMRDLQPFSDSPYLLYRGDGNTLHLIKNNGTNDTVLFSFTELSSFFVHRGNTVITISKKDGITTLESFSLEIN